MPPLDHADPPFAACSPTLRFLEPSALFFCLAFGTPSVSVGDRDPFHSLLLSNSFLHLRVIACVRRGYIRRPTQDPLVCCHCLAEQFAIARTLVKHIVVRDDLVLRFQ